MMRIYHPPRLGESLRAARSQKKLTQAQLARVAGVSRRHLAAVEGGANVSVAVLLKLVKALEISELTIDAVTLHFSNPPLDPPAAETDGDIGGPARGREPGES